MAAFSRGKRMLSASIMPSKPKKSRTRGLSPTEEAEWYFKAGLDKEGVIVKFISKEIGSGVFAATTFAKGDFIAEYTGERIDVEVGQYRDTHLYSRERHSYLYYFKHQERDICIDGSREYGRIGRMVNDSICPNARMKKLVIGGIPYLALFAVRDICPGQEIVYDYGVENLPWRINESTDSESDYDSDPFDLMDQDSGEPSPENSDQASPQENSGQSSPQSSPLELSPQFQSGQLSSPPEQSGQLSSPPEQSGQLSSPLEQSGQLSSPPEQSGQLSSPPEQSGQLSSPLEQSGQLSSPPEQSSQLSSPPEQSGQLSSPPEQSGQLSSPPEQSGQLSSPKEQSGQLSSPLEQSGQLSSPPEQSGQLSSPPEQSGQLSSPPEQSGQLSSPLEQSGQLSSPLEQSGQLSSPPEQSGQLSSPQEQSGQLSSPPEQSGQLSSPPEQSGQLSSPLEQSGQLSSPPEQSGQLSSPPEQSGQLSSPPEQSGQLSSPPEQPGQLSSPPEQSGQLSSPLEQSGQLSSPPEQSGQLSSPPEQSGQLSSPPEQSGQLSSPLEQSGQLSSPLEQSGQLSSPPEQSGQLSSPQEQSGQLSSPPEQSGQLSSPPEQSGQLSSPLEQSGQLSSPPEQSGQLSSPPEQSGQLSSPPEQSGQLSSPPEQPGQLSSPPEQSGQLSSPLEQSGQLSSPPEQSGQLSSPPEQSGQLSSPPEQSGQLSSPPEQSGQLSSPPEQPGQLSSPPEQSGQLSSPLEQSGQLSSPPEQSGQLSSPPEQSGQLSSPPEQSGQLSSPLEQSGQLSSPLEQSGQLSSPPEQSGQLSSPQEQSGQLSSPPEQSGQLSSPPEQSGQLSSPLEQSGQLSSPPEQSGQLSSPPEQSGQLSSPPEQSGQLSSPPEQPGQLSSPPEQSGQLSSPLEQSGQLSSPPEQSGQLSSPPEQSGQLSSPPEQSGQLSSPPEQPGQLSSPPEQSGQLSSPPEQSGQLSSPPEQSGQLSLPPEKSEHSRPVKCQGTVIEEGWDVVEDSCDSDVFPYAGNNDVQECDEQFAVAHPEYCGEIDFHLLAAGRNPIPRLCKKRSNSVMGDDTEVEEVGVETGSEFEMDSGTNQQSEADSLSDMADVPVDDIGEKPSQHRNNQILVSVAKHGSTTQKTKMNEEFTTAANSTSLTDHTQSKQRPERFCLYCKVIIKGGKLRRHIRRQHKAEDDVKHILTQNQAQQNSFFDQKRREGIYQYNLTKLVKSDSMGDLMRERRPNNEDRVRMCGGCHRFYSNRSFYKHRLTCDSLNPEPMKLFMVNSPNLHEDKEFTDDVLSKFRANAAGNLCREDLLIKQVGYRHFCLRRSENSKRDEVRKCVMTEMRELARLFLKFQELVSQEVSTEDMFARKYLSELRSAIEELSLKEGGNGEKHGLKLNYNSIILRTIKSLKGFYTETSQDSKYEELCKFHQAYLFRAHEMFAKAGYTCIARSLDKSRRPKELPDNDEVTKLKIFISHEVNVLSQEFELSNYSWLRSLIVTRLTLFNARRGEEPSRMLLSEFEDALQNVWLAPSDVENVTDEAERYLIGQFKLAYLHGKGRKYVPVLLPNDLLEPMKLLIKHRSAHGIREDNFFIFGTKHSSKHCSGWHAVKSVCDAAGVNINATKNRHRISTLYAALHMNDADKEVFFEHMGHDAAINKENYQCPQGVREVQVMGSLLNKIDKGESTKRTKPRRRPVVESSCESEEEVYPASGESTKRTKPRRRPVVESSCESEEEVYPASGKRCFDPRNDENSPPTKKSRSIKVQWNKEDTEVLHDFFSDYLGGETLNRCGNSGTLPSKRRIQAFLKQHQLTCLAHLDLEESYKKTRAKIFNDRKTMRHALKKKMKNLL